MALVYPRHLGGAVISDGGDKGSNNTTHEMGLPLPGSPLVIYPLSPPPIQPPSTMFVVAHIPLVRGGALRGPREPGCGSE